MSKNIKIIQVFVASPSDVQAERDILEGLITELNKTWSNSLGLMFELIRWETNVRPSFGTDPQSIINNQIGDSYDVFIGILWGRFGTPTLRSLSGTAEEFERAYNRLTSTEQKPEIMFYFKNTAISPVKIDPSQLQLVKSFRESISSLGGLYGEFEDELGFESSLRGHLAALAQKFSNSKNINSFENKPSITEIDSFIVDEDDLGYLDYTDIFELRMAEFSRTLASISIATSTIDEQIKLRTQEIEQISQYGPDVHTIRRIIKLSSGDMNAYAEILNLQLPLMSSSREAALQALTKALTLYKDDFNGTDHSDLKVVQELLGALKNAAEGSLSGITGFQLSIQGLPRVTKDINIAKRAVVKQLDSIKSEIEKTVHSVGNILESIEQIIP